jgi:hypothetical protein
METADLTCAFARLMDNYTPPSDLLSKTMTVVSFENGRSMVVEGERPDYSKYANVLVFTIYPKREEVE